MNLRFWRNDEAPPRPSEATLARIKAERDLARVRAETPKYRALAQSLVEIQQINHLGMNAAKMLRGEK